MKAVKAKLEENGASEEAVTKFMTGAQKYAAKIVANFKDYEFVSDPKPTCIYLAWRSSKYMGESVDTESIGMVLLLNYREDGITRECNRKI